MKTKKCHGCGEQKPIDQFSTNNKNADKLSSNCTACLQRNREYLAHRAEEARRWHPVLDKFLYGRAQ